MNSMTASANPKIEETSLLILAAGNSSRMGAPKGLLLINGVSLIETMINSYQSAGGKNIFVCVGKNHALYREKIHNVHFVQNDRVDLGQLYSAQLLLKATPTKFNFLTPVDLFAPPEIFWSEILREDTLINNVIIPRYQNRGGHPILVDQHAQAEIVQADPAKNRIDTIVKSNNALKYIFHETQFESVVQNLNSMNEFRRVMR